MVKHTNPEIDRRAAEFTDLTLKEVLNAAQPQPKTMADMLAEALGAVNKAAEEGRFNPEAVTQALSGDAPSVSSTPTPPDSYMQRQQAAIEASSVGMARLVELNEVMRGLEQAERANPSDEVAPRLKARVEQEIADLYAEHGWAPEPPTLAEDLQTARVLDELAAEIQATVQPPASSHTTPEASLAQEALRKIPEGTNRDDVARQTRQHEHQSQVEGMLGELGSDAPQELQGAAYDPFAEFAPKRAPGIRLADDSDKPFVLPRIFQSQQPPAEAPRAPQSAPAPQRPQTDALHEAIRTDDSATIEAIRQTVPQHEQANFDAAVQALHTAYHPAPAQATPSPAAPASAPEIQANAADRLAPEVAPTSSWLGTIRARATAVTQGLTHKVKSFINRGKQAETQPGFDAAALEEAVKNQDVATIGAMWKAAKADERAVFVEKVKEFKDKHLVASAPDVSASTPNASEAAPAPRTPTPPYTPNTEPLPKGPGLEMTAGDAAAAYAGRQGTGPAFSKPHSGPIDPQYARNVMNQRAEFAETVRHTREMLKRVGQKSLEPRVWEDVQKPEPREMWDDEMLKSMEGYVDSLPGISAPAAEPQPLSAADLRREAEEAAIRMQEDQEELARESMAGTWVSQNEAGDISLKEPSQRAYEAAFRKQAKTVETSAPEQEERPADEDYAPALKSHFREEDREAQEATLQAGNEYADARRAEEIEDLKRAAMEAVAEEINQAELEAELDLHYNRTLAMATVEGPVQEDNQRDW